MNSAVIQYQSSAKTNHVVEVLRQSEFFQHLVICGLPKTGTTLPLTLFDGHPELCVFPEELRFMDSGCQNMQNPDALVKLLHNHNTRQLQADVAWLDDYREHLGTGYGLRDYSNLEFKTFSATLDEAFQVANTPLQRYFACFYALETARGRQRTLLKNKPVLVSKSPNNELFMYSWERMLKNKVKFIWCVRNPFEHYLSIVNTSNKVGKNPMSVEQYCLWVKARNDLLPVENDNLFILGYEDLIENTEATVRAMADFAGIGFQQSLVHPTKNGTPWSGNSSRGIIRQGIYANPARAKEQLSADAIKTIETELAGMLSQFNYCL